MRVFQLAGLVMLIVLSSSCLPRVVEQGAPQAPLSSQPVSLDWKMPEHEKLTFRVKWLAITAGEITIEVKGIEEIRGRKAYRIEAHARTKGFCSTVYNVDSRYVSFLDVEKLHTLRHEVYRSEGHYRKIAVTEFDQEKHQAHFKSATDGSEKTFEILPDTQDEITALYIARLRVLAEKKPLEINICNNEQSYVAILNVVRRASLSVPRRGKREVYLVRPIDKYGKTVRQGRMTGYVSVEPGHEPYLFIIKAPVFTTVTASLVPQRS